MIRRQRDAGSHDVCSAGGRGSDLNHCRISCYHLRFYHLFTIFGSNGLTWRVQWQMIMIQLNGATGRNGIKRNGAGGRMRWVHCSVALVEQGLQRPMVGPAPCHFLLSLFSDWFVISGAMI